MNARPARPTMSAAAVLANGDGEYLIVKPGYKDGWNLPGGGVDEGETPRQACRRELKEELGIDQTPGRLLLSAYVHTADGAHIYWVFDGGTLTTQQRQAIVLQESELTAFRSAHLVRSPRTRSRRHAGLCGTRRSARSRTVVPSTWRSCARRC
jgi:8-oxo-dGTP diphosphatase